MHIKLLSRLVHLWLNNVMKKQVYRLYNLTVKVCLNYTGRLRIMQNNFTFLNLKHFHMQILLVKIVHYLLLSALHIVVLIYSYVIHSFTENLK